MFYKKYLTLGAGPYCLFSAVNDPAILIYGTYREGTFTLGILLWVIVMSEFRLS